MLNFLRFYFAEVGYNDEEVSIILLDKKYDEKGVGTWMIDLRIQESYDIIEDIYPKMHTPFFMIDGMDKFTNFAQVTE